MSDFSGAVRTLLARECTPARVRAAWDAAPEAPLAAWPHLAKAGVLGMLAPERWGGLGLDERELAPVLDETGRAALPDPIVEHAAVAIPLLAEAPEAMQDRWLGAAASGRALVTVSLGGLVLDAARADLLLIAQGGALHAVERRDATVTAEPSVDGARKLARVTWTRSTIVPGADLALAFDRGAVGAAAQLCGLARHLIDTTVEYARLRKQFGKPIGSFQAVKHQLAEAHVAVELARPCVARAAAAIAERAADRAAWVSLAKAHASDAARVAARAALQCHGAIGYSFEHDLHLWMKRAWALAAAWGDAAHHRARIAGAILGEHHG